MKEFSRLALQHTLWRRTLHLGPRPKFAEADLANAVIKSQNLRWADFSNADCSTASFVSCDLRNADFSEANLVGAKFIGCKLTEHIYKGGAYFEILAQNNLRARTVTEVSDGHYTVTDIHAPLHSAESITGYKILHAIDSTDNYRQVRTIAKLTIPMEAHCAIYKGDKCRASKAYVEEIYDPFKKRYYAFGISCVWNRFTSFSYEVGEYAIADNFDENLYAVCTNGIHFFLTEEEAIDYMKILAV